MKRVLVVGSSIIDIFLTLDRADEATYKDNTVSFELGSKNPIDIESLTMGGNGANVSVGLSRLTIPTIFFTYLGQDILSQHIENSITREGIELLIERGESKNSSLSLIFGFKTDRIIFDHHQIREHGFSYTNTAPDALYLTSIGEEWTGAYKKVLAYAKENQILLAFSPGSHQLATMEDPFFEAMSTSAIFFGNKEEAERILDHKQIPHNSIESLTEGIQGLGPQIVSITDGGKGSYAKKGTEQLFKMNAIDDADIVEKTGAGDSYATAFFAAFLMNHSIEECMRWGVANASGVMKKIGAQEGLLTIEELQKWLDAHKEFIATPI